MKTKNIFRMQAIVIGFAGALLLAGAAPAQEIENKGWPDRPGATAPFDTVASQTAAAPAPAASITATASASKPVVAQEAAVSQWSTIDAVAATVLLIFFAVVAMSKRAGARYAKRHSEGRVEQVDDGVALS
jgi:hypothetical protein